jgi:hypothetical protein
MVDHRRLWPLRIALPPRRHALTAPSTTTAPPSPAQALISSPRRSRAMRDGNRTDPTTTTTEHQHE